MSERAGACIHVATVAVPVGVVRVVVDAVSAADASAVMAPAVLIISDPEDVDRLAFVCGQASSVRLEVRDAAPTECHWRTAECFQR